MSAARPVPPRRRTPRAGAVLGRLIVALACAGVFTACGDRDGGEPAEQPAPPVLTPGGATSVPPATARHFDPGSLTVGDTFLNLRVAAVDVRRAFEDSVWVGHVRFEGQIGITGEYRRHFDWPEPAELCFWISMPSSIERIPDFAPDAWTSANQQTWFCFTNTELAQELLGDGAEPVRATIVVDDYTSRREFTDTYDTARLVDVTAIAEPQR